MYRLSRNIKKKPNSEKKLFPIDFYKDYDREGQTLSARISYEEGQDDGIEDIEDFSTFPVLSESTFEKVSNIDFQKRFQTKKKLF